MWTDIQKSFLCNFKIDAWRKTIRFLILSPSKPNVFLKLSSALRCTGPWLLLWLLCHSSLSFTSAAGMRFSPAPCCLTCACVNSSSRRDQRGAPLTLVGEAPSSSGQGWFTVSGSWGLSAGVLENLTWGWGYTWKMGMQEVEVAP